MANVNSHIYGEKKDAVDSGKVIASFVLGILSVVLCPLPFMLIAAVVGLIFERESEKTGYHSLQTAAKVLCIIGIVLCSLSILTILAVAFGLQIISR